MDVDVLKTAAGKHKADIPEPFDQLMERCGFDAVNAFCDCFGGGNVYIPSLHTILKRCLELEAIQEFDGGRYSDLARKYGFSERHMRKIIKASKAKRLG